MLGADFFFSTTGVTRRDYIYRVLINGAKIEENDQFVGGNDIYYQDLSSSNDRSPPLMEKFGKDGFSRNHSSSAIYGY